MKKYVVNLMNGKKYNMNDENSLLLHPDLLDINMSKLERKYKQLIISAYPKTDNLTVVENIFKKVGIIDRNSNIIVDFIYDEIGDFCEGYAMVKKDNKYGFIDMQGNVIVDIIYDKVNNFSEGYAVVVKNGKYGLIRKDNKLAIGCTFDRVDDVKNGIVACFGYGKIYEEGARSVSDKGFSTVCLNSGFHLLKAKDNEIDKKSVNNKKYDKIDLDALMRTRDEDIKKCKVILDTVKNLTAKFDDVPVVFDLESFCLIPVLDWHVEDVFYDENGKKLPISKDTHILMKVLKGDS